MLELTDIVATGRTRTVYRHPTDPGKVVKIENTVGFADADKVILAIRSVLRLLALTKSENERELTIYNLVAPHLARFLTVYEPALVETSQGKGLVCEFIQNENGTPAQSILSHMNKGGYLDEPVQASLAQFFETLRRHDLFFFDFNRDNFLIQQTTNGPMLKFIDIKGYRRDRAIFSLTRISAKAARRKMERRIARFYKLIDGDAQTG